MVYLTILTMLLGQLSSSPEPHVLYAAYAVGGEIVTCPGETEPDEERVCIDTASDYAAATLALDDVYARAGYERVTLWRRSDQATYHAIYNVGSAMVLITWSDASPHIEVTWTP